MNADIPKPTRTPINRNKRSPFNVVTDEASETTSNVPPAPVTPATPPPGATETAAAGNRFTRSVLLAMTEAQKARIFATQVHTQPYTGVTSQQAFMRWALDELCARLETEYNNGQPFPTPGTPGR